jgi:hypothetical protein
LNFVIDANIERHFKTGEKGHEVENQDQVEVESFFQCKTTTHYQHHRNRRLPVNTIGQLRFLVPAYLINFPINNLSAHPLSRLRLYGIKDPSREGRLFLCKAEK